MRQRLLATFDEIYVLDLHGGSKKKERAPDGTPDQNVFDIQQGVAICLFVKLPKAAKPGGVCHAELFGSREAKYKALLRQDVASTKWTRLKPKTPACFLKPQFVKHRAEYEAGWKLTEIMPVNSAGIVTARDHLTIHWTADEAWDTVRAFAALAPERARETYDLGDDAQDWTVHAAQDDVRKSGPEKGKITAILYRPFDIRHTYYTGRAQGFMCRPRAETMRHMLADENLALIATRQTRDKWDVLATRSIAGHKTCAAFDINTVFPLYLYQNGDVPESLFDHENGRRPNLSAEFIAELTARLKLAFIADGTGDLKKNVGPEDLFHYIYAVFHSPAYRERYAEFLKTDFPRVPITTDLRVFRRLCSLGTELVSLHLLEAELLNLVVLKVGKRTERLAVCYPVPGDNEVAKAHPKYLAPGQADPQTGRPLKLGRVYISSGDAKGGRKGQYFEGVPPEVWEFHIGGYQVCEKWLKDRQGRQLTFDDLTHYQKVVVALKETIRLMKEIDAAIPRWPLA
jgi:predicted helicase